MRRVNFVFLAALLIIAALLGGGMYLLHGVQVRRHASVVLTLARKAELSGDLPGPVKLLRQYIGLHAEETAPPSRGTVHIFDRNTPPTGRRGMVLAVYEEALLKNRNDLELERRCLDIAMEPAVQLYTEAFRHLKRLHEAVQDDPDRRAEAAELEDLLGQCFQATSQPEKAEQAYRQAIAHDPARVAATSGWPGSCGRHSGKPWTPIARSRRWWRRTRARPRPCSSVTATAASSG